MNLSVSCVTDIGTTRATNQDNFYARVIEINDAQIAFLVLCDGMGGYEKGEVASASVIGYFEDWFENRFRGLYERGLSDDLIRSEWSALISTVDEGLKKYGSENFVRLGTTVTGVLITQERYYALNVGDSRTYSITNRMKKITRDHSFVEREVELGRLTEEEALTDSRRNILTQCLGAGSNAIRPDFFFGEPIVPSAFLLCSDGFWHDLTEEEVVDSINSYSAGDSATGERVLRDLIELVKARGETDNITVCVCKMSGNSNLASSVETTMLL